MTETERKEKIDQWWGECVASSSDQSPLSDTSGSARIAELEKACTRLHKSAQENATLAGDLLSENRKLTKAIGDMSNERQVSALTINDVLEDAGCTFRVPNHL